jgi:hypothetical protein
MSKEFDKDILSFMAFMFTICLLFIAAVFVVVETFSATGFVLCYEATIKEYL